MHDNHRLALPPPYAQHRLDKGDVMLEAIRRAPEEGAGTLVWRSGDGLLAFAVVLEPEQKLAEARLAFLAGMVALAEALVAHCPPERAVRFGWPDILLYDRARLGGGRFAVPEGCAEDKTPLWMVFAAELIADRDHLHAPGTFPDSTSLKEEEFASPPTIVESFAAYLMLNFDRWAHQERQAVTSRYLERLDPPLAEGSRVIGLDCELVEQSSSFGERRSGLVEGLTLSTWRDPVAGRPRL